MTERLTDLTAAEAALTEARAREAAAWEAGRDAAARAVHAFARALNWHPSNVTDCVASILRLTPPPDAAAALTARLDAELERAAAEADACPDSHWGPWIASRIRALRRNTETSND